jgi:hypothetical protein
VPLHFRPFRDSQRHGNFFPKLFLLCCNLRRRGRIFMNKTKEKTRIAAFLP